MPLPFDSVYFLMAPGWRTEARSNRWHYSCRWARHAPVVLVQPELSPGSDARSEVELRIGNVEILSVREASLRPSFSAGLIQAQQIISFMQQRDHRRPLLWFYNPNLAFAYALLPAVARIFHATENHFDFDLHAGFYEMLKASVAVSDKIICCSGGLFADYRAASGRDNVEVVPNGCDYAFYADAKPPAGDWFDTLREVIAKACPIAVFAGNINWRMDFPLMHRLAEALADLHFVYAGQLQEWTLDAEDRISWAGLLRRRNVTYLGNLDAENLPGLYRVSDRGFIPYRHVPLLVKNGFPLKALEMAAAGLPVVSSLMEPLLAAADAVTVVTSGDQFVDSLKVASRRTRSPEAAARAAALCCRHDYDRLFETALRVVLKGPFAGPPAPASLAPIYEHIPLDHAARDLPIAEAHTVETERVNVAYMKEIDRLHEVYPAEIASLNDELQETKVWRGFKRGIGGLRVLARHPLGRALLTEISVGKRVKVDLLLQLARVVAAGRALPASEVFVVPLLAGSELVLNAAPTEEAARLSNKAAVPGSLLGALGAMQVKRCTLVVDSAIKGSSRLLTRSRYDLPDLLQWLTRRPDRLLSLLSAPPAGAESSVSTDRFRRVMAT